MKKSALIQILYYWNIIMLITYLLMIFMSFNSNYFKILFFQNITVLTIRTVCVIPVLIFTVYCMILWSKKDKHVLNFFLLFFLMGIYTPFYYRKALKNNWILKSTLAKN